MSVEAKDILFMGLSKSAVAWYRCYLPAIHLKADWVGVAGEPPLLHVMTGLVKGDTVLPKYDDYKVVIIQQPYGQKWVEQILAIQRRGIKVLYEVDDYLHGVEKQATHDYAKWYTKERLKQYELCMRVCDGVICSTNYIARRYAKYNRRMFVCKNGIDMARYNLTRPERPTVNIGWAGATGHTQALMPWLKAVLQVMREYENTTFVAIGQPGVAVPFQRELGEHRAVGIPFTSMESYPAAMTMFDVALAPAGRTSWYRGKSDLRWLEASALAIPVIGDPYVYPEIDDGYTGFHAEDSGKVVEILRTLITNTAHREQVGRLAKIDVEQRRHIRVAAFQWRLVCAAVVDGMPTALELVRK